MCRCVDCIPPMNPPQECSFSLPMHGDRSLLQSSTITASTAVSSSELLPSINLHHRMFSHCRISMSDELGLGRVLLSLARSPNVSTAGSLTTSPLPHMGPGRFTALTLGRGRTKDWPRYNRSLPRLREHCTFPLKILVSFMLNASFMAETLWNQRSPV